MIEEFLKKNVSTWSPYRFALEKNVSILSAFRRAVAIIDSIWSPSRRAVAIIVSISTGAELSLFSPIDNKSFVIDLGLR